MNFDFAFDLFFAIALVIFAVGVAIYTLYSFYRIRKIQKSNSSYIKLYNLTDDDRSVSENLLSMGVIFMLLNMNFFEDIGKPLQSIYHLSTIFSFVWLAVCIFEVILNIKFAHVAFINKDNLIFVNRVIKSDNTKYLVTCARTLSRLTYQEESCIFLYAHDKKPLCFQALEREEEVKDIIKNNYRFIGEK
jgi:hypothetical protein